MLQTLEGTFRNGKVELTETPPAGAGEAKVLVDSAARPRGVLPVPYDPSKDAGPFNEPPTPFHDAAEVGDIVAMKAMIAAGADCNEEDWTGQPPLSRAIAGGSLDAVRVLLEAGAAPDGGNTCARPFVEAADANRIDIMRLLFQLGAVPDITSQGNGENALIPAAYHGNLEMVGWLLDLGVSPNVIARKGITALGAAAEMGHAPIAARLRAAGARDLGDEGEAE